MSHAVGQCSRPVGIPPKQPALLYLIHAATAAADGAKDSWLLTAIMASHDTLGTHQVVGKGGSVRARLQSLKLHRDAGPAAAGAHLLPLLAIVIFDQICNVGAITGFALSGKASSAREFLAWQALGSLFGLATQLSFAGMVRLGSVRFANTIDIGLAFLTAQLFSAYLFFHEPFTSAQWFGTVLIVIGVVLLAHGR